MNLYEIRRPSAVPSLPALRHRLRASNSREDLAGFDTLRCLTCQTTITEFAPPASEAGRSIN